MRKNQTRAVAICGITAALSLIVMFTASISYSGYLALTALAGCLLGPLIVKYGKLYGLLTYAAAIVLGLLMIPDKLIVLLYTLFFGMYPVIKEIIEEKIKKRIPATFLKLLFFNAVFTAGVYLSEALFAVNIEKMVPLPLIFIGANLIFLCFDFAYSRLLNEVMFRYGKYL